MTDIEFLEQIEAGLRREPCGFTVAQMRQLFTLAHVPTACWNGKRDTHTIMLRTEAAKRIVRGLVTGARNIAKERR